MWIAQVWSFSPPEEALIELDRSPSPMSMPDGSMMEYDLGHGDIDMADAVEPLRPRPSHGR